MSPTESRHRPKRCRTSSGANGNRDVAHSSARAAIRAFRLAPRERGTAKPAALGGGLETRIASRTNTTDRRRRLPVARPNFGRYDGGVCVPPSFQPLRIMLALSAAFVSPICLWYPAAASELADTLADIYVDHDVQSELPAPSREPTSTEFQGAMLFQGAPRIAYAVLCAIAIVLLAAWLARTDLKGLLARARARRLTGLLAAQIPRLLARARARRRRPAMNEDAATHETPDRFATADVLARQGRYAEAVHALLLGALAILSADARRWPTAATGREIAAHHVRAADLGVLVEVAERAHFGGRPASAAEYRACRERATRLCHRFAGHGSAGRIGEPDRVRRGD